MLSGANGSASATAVSSFEGAAADSAAPTAPTRARAAMAASRRCRMVRAKARSDVKRPRRPKVAWLSSDVLRLVEPATQLDQLAPPSPVLPLEVEEGAKLAQRRSG